MRFLPRGSALLLLAAARGAGSFVHISLAMESGAPRALPTASLTSPTGFLTMQIKEHVWRGAKNFYLIPFESYPHLSSFQHP